ncbi:hypothetical protein M011DRAFT_449127 [Sporormia fimetaria CBS 119925]|uniref:Glycosyl transferase CAP10 domain-containing protein n=1 Tax=Sporormia fimetaria CBS 119925 TaxID=1340428 RepID=A0A6A6V5M0_9PLEO|nr:hypothetical protein M011DRAFT_449127 [Sporormia fimetaria CBS 119925]
MAPFRKRAIIFCVFLAVILWRFAGSGSKSFYFTLKRTQTHTETPASSTKDGGVVNSSLWTRLNLTETECATAFPGLFTDITNNIKNGPFIFAKANPNYQGLVQGRIIDGNRLSTLSQLHRALLTSPSHLPNIHFAFVTNDVPKNNSWAFARPNKSHSGNIWLIPHPAFWASPLPPLHPLDTILSRISTLESQTTFSQKLDKVVWRGTPWFNPLAYPLLRQHLLKATKGKEWADIDAFDIGAKGEYRNALPIEQFCGYRYVVYTEGVTYSGRLPYHQACASVLVMAPVTWVTHTGFWLRPIWAGDLMGGGREDGGGGEGGETLVETVEDWREANTVYVDPKFEMLEDVVMFLRRNPEVAETLARNLRQSGVGTGFLGPAAEVCYWRALIRGWASVVRTGETWGDEVGVRYEEWILREVARGK